MHDFLVLTPILESRGFNVSQARDICDFRWQVGANRITECYEDGTYHLDLRVFDPLLPAIFNPELNSLRKVSSLSITVSSGPLPPGVETLGLQALSITGTKSGGLEGPLPPGFWSLRVSSLTIADMDSRFNGSLASELLVCDHLDGELSLYNLPALTGDISSLEACISLRQKVLIYNVPLITGNAWDLLLSWGSPIAPHIEIRLAAGFGEVPYAEVVAGNETVNPWDDWCAAATFEFGLWIE